MAEIIGWISLHRKIQEHWIWKDANKFKWWIDILLTVNTKEAKVAIGNEVFICKRGESLLSIQSWATRWGVSKDAARNFMTLLEKDNMIVRVSLGKSTRLTVCNYESYQYGLHVKKTVGVRETNTNNNNNKVDTKVSTVEQREGFIKMINSITGRVFKKMDEKAIKQFNVLLTEGYVKKDFRKAITIALSEMKQRGTHLYLNPEFITRPVEFQKYVTMDLSSIDINDYEPLMADN